MKRIYKWDEVGRIARAARFACPPTSRRRIRRTPRDPAKDEALYQMAVTRMKKYPPTLKNGKLILPYYLES